MINYLSRHTNPCVTSLEPARNGRVRPGEDDRRLYHSQSRFCDRVVCQLWEYGETFFGQQERFGLEAQQWIDAHYQSSA